jgi:hypothetical protein
VVRTAPESGQDWYWYLGECARAEFLALKHGEDAVRKVAELRNLKAGQHLALGARESAAVYLRSGPVRTRSGVSHANNSAALSLQDSSHLD